MSDSPTFKTVQPQTIPIFDLRDFTHGTKEQHRDFVLGMGKALREIGFFSLVNHGLDEEMLDRAYDVTMRFFELDESVKRRYEIPGLKGQRGFTSFGKEHAKNSDAPDLKEFWHVGRTFPEGHKLANAYPPNVWPREVLHFRATMMEMYQRLDECSMRLLEACALFLDEVPHKIKEMATGGNTILRAIHYPEIAPDMDPRSIRSAAHEDINLITLLCAATSDGLELLQRDGSWLKVRSSREEIIVDAGDMLQNLSNGVFKSTTHRVVNPDNSRERRFSMPFFVHPRSEISLQPLRTCIDMMGGCIRYPNITAGDYLAKRLSEIGLDQGRES